MRRGLGAIGGAAVALALARASSARAGPGPSTASDAQQRLADVYARPPLDRLDRPPPHTPLDDLLTRIGDLFSRLASGVPGGLPIGIAAAVALALLVLWLLRRVSAGRRIAVAEAEPADTTLDADAEWAAALAAAARGDLREAVRRAFRSALLAVAVAGRLEVDAAWTTRELLAHTAGDADLLAALAPAAAAFDVAWYSGRPVGVADWDAQRARCEAIRALARRGRGVGARAVR